MATVGETATKHQKRRHPASRGTKLGPLPHNAQIHKRPLLRPPIPSAHASSSSQKVIYIGTKTPFLSAVKRAEKLLQLSDKRLVQSAARLAQNASKKGRRRGGDEDRIETIAEFTEEQKRSRAEEVILKGTGKAIPKVMELALWFQQRDLEYAVRLQTGSVSSIDDISYREDDASNEDATEETRIRKVSVLEVLVRLR